MKHNIVLQLTFPCHPGVFYGVRRSAQGGEVMLGNPRELWRYMAVCLTIPPPSPPPSRQPPIHLLFYYLILPYQTSVFLLIWLHMFVM